MPDLERRQTMQNMKRIREKKGIVTAATTPCLQQPNRAAPSKAQLTPNQRFPRKIQQCSMNFAPLQWERIVLPEKDGLPYVCPHGSLPCSFLPDSQNISFYPKQAEPKPFTSSKALGPCSEGDCSAQGFFAASAVKHVRYSAL